MQVRRYLGSWLVQCDLCGAGGQPPKAENSTGVAAVTVADWTLVDANPSSRSPQVLPVLVYKQITSRPWLRPNLELQIKIHVRDQSQILHFICPG